MTCPGCAAAADPGWQYCAYCGTALHEQSGAAARDHHVTVVVSDLQGSTALAERLDPESLRAVLDDYFDELGRVLESYGGRIEKRIGDAMVTVFGLPVARDDDAHRAVTAVAECQATLASLNERLARAFGVRLVNRTGICTGPVLFTDAGAGHRVLTGRALAVASGLEPLAPPLEALVAIATLDELGDDVVTEPVAEHTLRGSGEVILAARLVSSQGSAPTDVAEEANPGRCAVCAAELTPDAEPLWRWCPQCASPLPLGGKRRESRRTLTIVFGDLRAVDASPDDARAATVACFEQLRDVLERHGGTVEKYIGDAVMAVWGLSQRHEDDALRAVRAAVEMQRVVDARNATGDGAHLELRIGVNTGPVIAGDPRLGQRLVTGDAVNVAARLEQTAGLGDIVIGDLTRRLAGGGASVDELAPLTLKGKAEPVRAFRVAEVAHATAGPGRLELPLIGRDDELAALQHAFHGAVGERHWQRIHVVGDAGMGKSRLVHELVDTLGTEVRVLRGACLPYGEGITFWPITEILATAAGFGPTDEPERVREAVLAAVDGEADVALRLWSLAGVHDQQYPVAETFWAVRRLLEHAAAQHPLLVVLDGYHWSEPTLRELVDSLVGAERDTPLLLLTLARPEHDDHPVGSIVLDSLADEEADAVIVAALGGGTLPADLRARISAAAAGNPLFIEQFLTMLVDDGLLVGDGTTWWVTGDIAKVSVPPTVEAVLAARVDTLGDDERATLEPASVVGRDFARGAIDALVERPLPTERTLGTLRDRQLVTTAREPDVISDHRFRSMMLRDVVYEGLLKRERSQLHERYAGWLETLPDLQGRLTDLEEILGYHLEQAYVLRNEIAAFDDALGDVGRRAARYLASAGDRAFARGDMPAAANLLCRAADTLQPDDAGRPAVLIRAGEARVETGELREARRLFEEAQSASEAAGDEPGAAAAAVALVVLRYQSGDGVSDADAKAAVDALRPVLQRAGDHRSLARGHYVDMLVELTHCQFGAAERSALAIVSDARLSGDATLEGRTLPLLAVVALHGPTPTDEAVQRCEEILRGLTSDRRSKAMTERYLAVLLAMQERFDEGRALCRDARQSLAELGWQFDLALVGLEWGPLELMADRPDEAERALRPGYDALDAMGERNYISTVAALLAESVCRQGRYDEARTLAEHAAEVAADDDVITQAFVRAVLAKLASAAGDHATAESIAVEACELLAATDDIASQADVLVDLALVRQAADGTDAALDAVRAAIDRYTTKGHRPGLRRARALEATLTA